MSTETSTVLDYLGLENGMSFVKGQGLTLELPEYSTMVIEECVVKETDGSAVLEYDGTSLDEFNNLFNNLSATKVYLLEFSVSNGENIYKYSGEIDFSINTVDTVSIAQTADQVSNLFAKGTNATISYVEGNFGGRKGAYEWTSGTATSGSNKVTVTLAENSLNKNNLKAGKYFYFDFYTTCSFGLMVNHSTYSYYMYSKVYDNVKIFDANGNLVTDRSALLWKNKWVTIEICLEVDYEFNSEWRGILTPGSNYGLTETDSNHIYLDNFRVSTTSIYEDTSSPTLTQTAVVQSNDYSASYPVFEGLASPEYLVPGLNEGIIPQGMDVWEEKKLLLITGYFKTYTDYWPSSLIMTVDLTTGKLVGYYFMKNVSGSYYTGHASGIAVTEKNIFIASSGSKLSRIPLSQLESVGNSGVLNFVDEIVVPVKTSFVNYTNGMLLMGDFYNVETHETPEWRHMVNNDGTTYCAWMIGYKLKDTESEFSSENWDSATMEYATPDYIFSIADRIQGATMCGENIVLSQSYGRTNDSKILIYENVINNEQDTSYTLNDKQIPVWFLDSGVLAESYTTMPMSEGVSIYNNKILILFESGAAYYREDGAINPTDHVWGLTLPN